MTNNFITPYSLIFDLLLLLFILMPVLILSYYKSREQRKNRVPNSNQKRLDRLFEEMGKKHFAQNYKGKIVWEKIHLILKSLNYDIPKIKKLSKIPQKTPEFIFISKNYDQIEKLILRYRSLPELKIAVSNPNSPTSSGNRGHLNLV
ncbi:MAG: hypothetical protein OEY33_08650 [Bdellovibrionales bacterium]|nr:hypothetical protein [Bdellovibrionales bacterium]